MRLRHWQQLALAALVALAALSLVRACASEQPTSEVAADSPLPESIPLPDLSVVASPELRHLVEAARAAVEHAPESATTWGELGIIYHMQKWHPDAVACYERASRLSPRDYRWHYLRGRVYEQVNVADGVGAFAEAIELETGDPSLHVAYARALRRLGRDDLARHHLTEAAVLAPDNPYSELGLGQLDLAAGSLESARAHLNRALALNPGQSEAHQALAQVHLSLGDREAAESHVVAARRKSAFRAMPDPVRDQVSEVMTRHLAAARQWLSQQAAVAAPP